MQATIRELMTTAGIKNISRAVQMLRHTTGVALGLRGANEWEIQQALGYTDVLDARRYKSEASDELRRRLGGGFSGLRRVRDEAARDRNLFQGPNLYYLKDGRGPYSRIHECLDALGVPEGSRRKYWHRHDRLPARYRNQITVVKRHRSFVYDGIELPDPDPRLTIDEVRRVFEEFFPELGHANLTVKESQDGGKTVYTFERTHGSKGCDDNELPHSADGHRHQRGRSSRALAAV